MNEKPAVIIAHGLLMNQFVMRFLKTQFSRLGYDTYMYDYCTIEFNEQRVCKELKVLTQSIANHKKCFLGHSMGGLVFRKFLENQNFLDAQNTSLVTIGTPHTQSLLAHKLSNTILNPIFKYSGNAGLTQELGAWSEKYPLGCIAGTRSIGLNNFFGLFIDLDKTSASDGTVYVSEAICPGATDSCTLDLTHTTLIFSLDTVAQAHNFFCHKKFILEPEIIKKFKIR